MSRRTDRVVVLRALRGLGDVLVALPGLRALRAARPDAHVTYLGAASNAVVLDRFPGYVDELVAFPGWPGLPDLPVDVAATTALLACFQRAGVELALQWHGSGTLTNPIVGLLGARRSAGYHLPGAWCPDPATWLPYDPAVPEVLRPLAILDHLGLAPEGCGPEAGTFTFPVTDADRAEADRLGLPPGPYVVVNPGAAHDRRRWPARRFAQVADALARDGYQVVLIGGAADAPLAAEVAAAMHHPALDLGGRTSLGGVAAVVASAALVVTNDTGIAHLAVGVGTPSVVVFQWSDARRWGPLDRSRHGVVGPVVAFPAAGAEASRRCLADGCRRLDEGALVRPLAVPAVADVLAAARERLGVGTR